MGSWWREKVGKGQQQQGIVSQTINCVVSAGKSLGPFVTLKLCYSANKYNTCA